MVLRRECKRCRVCRRPKRTMEPNCHRGGEERNRVQVSCMLIVVYGLPAAGKTSLCRTLLHAPAFRHALIASFCRCHKSARAVASQTMPPAGSLARAAAPVYPASAAADFARGVASGDASDAASTAGTGFTSVKGAVTAVAVAPKDVAERAKGASSLKEGAEGGTRRQRPVMAQSIADSPELTQTDASATRRGDVAVTPPTAPTAGGKAARSSPGHAATGAHVTAAAQAMRTSETTCAGASRLDAKDISKSAPMLLQQRLCRGGRKGGQKHQRQCQQQQQEQLSHQQQQYPGGVQCRRKPSILLLHVSCDGFERDLLRFRETHVREQQQQQQVQPQLQRRQAKKQLQHQKQQQKQSPTDAEQKQKQQHQCSERNVQQTRLSQRQEDEELQQRGRVPDVLQQGQDTYCQEHRLQETCTAKVFPLSFDADLWRAARKAAAAFVVSLLQNLYAIERLISSSSVEGSTTTSTPPTTVEMAASRPAVAAPATPATAAGVGSSSPLTAGVPAAACVPATSASVSRTHSAHASTPAARSSNPAGAGWVSPCTPVLAAAHSAAACTNPAVVGTFPPWVPSKAASDGSADAPSGVARAFADAAATVSLSGTSAAIDSAAGRAGCKSRESVKRRCAASISRHGDRQNDSVPTAGSSVTASISRDSCDNPSEVNSSNTSSIVAETPLHPSPTGHNSSNCAGPAVGVAEAFTITREVLLRWVVKRIWNDVCSSFAAALSTRAPAAAMEKTPECDERNSCRGRAAPGGTSALTAAAGGESNDVDNAAATAAAPSAAAGAARYATVAMTEEASCLLERATGVFFCYYAPSREEQHQREQQQSTLRQQQRHAMQQKDQKHEQQQREGRQVQQEEYVEKPQEADEMEKRKQTSGCCDEQLLVVLLLDDTMALPSQRKYYFQLARKYPRCAFHQILIDTPLSVCLQRNRLRTQQQRHAFPYQQRPRKKQVALSQERQVKEKQQPLQPSPEQQEGIQQRAPQQYLRQSLQQGETLQDKKEKNEEKHGEKEQRHLCERRSPRGRRLLLEQYQASLWMNTLSLQWKMVSREHEAGASGPGFFSAHSCSGGGERSTTATGIGKTAAEAPITTREGVGSVTAAASARQGMRSPETMQDAASAARQTEAETIRTRDAGVFWEEAAASAATTESTTDTSMQMTTETVTETTAATGRLSSTAEARAAKNMIHEPAFVYPPDWLLQHQHATLVSAQRQHLKRKRKKNRGGGTVIEDALMQHKTEEERRERSNSTARQESRVVSLNPRTQMRLRQQKVPAAVISGHGQQETKLLQGRPQQHRQSLLGQRQQQQEAEIQAQWCCAGDSCCMQGKIMNAVSLSYPPAQDPDGIPVCGGSSHKTTRCNSNNIVSVRIASVDLSSSTGHSGGSRAGSSAVSKSSEYSGSKISNGWSDTSSRNSSWEGKTDGPPRDGCRPADLINPCSANGSTAMAAFCASGPSPAAGPAAHTYGDDGDCSAVAVPQLYSQVTCGGAQRTARSSTAGTRVDLPFAFVRGRASDSAAAAAGCAPRSLSISVAAASAGPTVIGTVAGDASDSASVPAFKPTVSLVSAHHTGDAAVPARPAASAVSAAVASGGAENILRSHRRSSTKIVASTSCSRATTAAGSCSCCCLAPPSSICTCLSSSRYVYSASCRRSCCCCCWRCESCCWKEEKKGTLLRRQQLLRTWESRWPFCHSWVLQLDNPVFCSSLSSLSSYFSCPSPLAEQVSAICSRLLACKRGCAWQAAASGRAAPPPVSASSLFHVSWPPLFSSSSCSVDSTGSFCCMQWISSKGKEQQEEPHSQTQEPHRQQQSLKGVQEVEIKLRRLVHDALAGLPASVPTTCRSSLAKAWKTRKTASLHHCRRLLLAEKPAAPSGARRGTPQEERTTPNSGQKRDDGRGDIGAASELRAWNEQDLGGETEVTTLAAILERFRRQCEADARAAARNYACE